MNSNINANFRKLHKLKCAVTNLQSWCHLTTRPHTKNSSKPNTYNLLQDSTYHSGSTRNFLNAECKLTLTSSPSSLFPILKSRGGMYNVKDHIQ